MITLTNLNQSKSIPAMFDTEAEFIEYTISEALWIAIPTGEIQTMEKMGFTKIVDDLYTEENGTKSEVIHWEADMDTCLKFWSDAVEGWEVKIYVKQ